MLSIKKAKYLKEYKVELQFDNGEIGIADLKDELYGIMFEPLKEKSIFKKLKVDKDLKTISWENGADLAPEFLYFKSFEKDPKLQKQFKDWGYIN